MRCAEPVAVAATTALSAAEMAFPSLHPSGVLHALEDLGGGPADGNRVRMFRRQGFRGSQHAQADGQLVPVDSGVCVGVRAGAVPNGAGR